jgi:hypothetical protein
MGALPWERILRQDSGVKQQRKKKSRFRETGRRCGGGPCWMALVEGGRGVYFGRGVGGGDAMLG